jgi:hypothetical protein
MEKLKMNTEEVASTTEDSVKRPRGRTRKVVESEAGSSATANPVAPAPSSADAGHAAPAPAPAPSRLHISNPVK